jgi:hypothetical protein
MLVSLHVFRFDSTILSQLPRPYIFQVVRSTIVSTTNGIARLILYSLKVEE